MKRTNSSPLARLRRATFGALAAHAAIFPARAQINAPATPLAPFVTTATRTPQDQQTIGSVVDVITANDLAREQITSLAQALGAVAGAPHFSSGANGAVNSRSPCTRRRPPPAAAGRR